MLTFMTLLKPGFSVSVGDYSRTLLAAVGGMRRYAGINACLANNMGSIVTNSIVSGRSHRRSAAILKQIFVVVSMRLFAYE